MVARPPCSLLPFCPRPRRPPRPSVVQQERRRRRGMLLLRLAGGAGTLGCQRQPSRRARGGQGRAPSLRSDAICAWGNVDSGFGGGDENPKGTAILQSNQRPAKTDACVSKRCRRRRGARLRRRRPQRAAAAPSRCWRRAMAKGAYRGRSRALSLPTKAELDLGGSLPFVFSSSRHLTSNPPHPLAPPPQPAAHSAHSAWRTTTTHTQQHEE